MKKNRLIVTGIILLLGAGLWYYHASTSAPAPLKYVTATAAKSTLITTVSGSGNVVVDQITKVNPSISGTVSDLAVKLGDSVKKGQTLFTIVNNQLDVTVDKSYASYLQAKQAVASAEASVTTAQATASNQSQDSGQAKAQAGVDQANQNLLAAQAQLSQDQQVLNATASSANNYATLQAKVANDQAALTTAQDNLAASTIALQQSQNSQAATAQAAKQQLVAAQAAVQVAQKNLDAAFADYQNQKAIADGRTVTAPIDGTITTLSISNGDQLGSTSSAVSGSANASSTSSAPIVIADLGTLKSSVQINEVDASKVQTGQKASMTFDAIDGLSLTGKIEKIDTVGTVSQGVVSYTATIDFDALDKRVRPQMSTSAAITISVKQDVLTVPNSAVKTQNGTSVVQVMKNGVPGQQDVQIGESNDSDTEITSGLNVGDTVVTQTIDPNASKTATASRSGGSGIPGLGGGAVRFGGGGGRAGN